MVQWRQTLRRLGVSQPCCRLLQTSAWVTAGGDTNIGLEDIIYHKQMLWHHSQVCVERVSALPSRRVHTIASVLITENTVCIQDSLRPVFGARREEAPHHGLMMNARSFQHRVWALPCTVDRKAYCTVAHCTVCFCPCVLRRRLFASPQLVWDLPPSVPLFGHRLTTHCKRCYIGPLAHVLDAADGAEEIERTKTGRKRLQEVVMA